MSFELEDSEEDFSGLDDGYEEGALHEEIGLTLQPLPSYPVKDEYEFDLEESASASRADSPVAALPPPPPPPPPQPPALSFSAAALARSRGAAPQSSRFKQQPERMRRSTEEAEEEEEDGGAMGEAGEEEEEEEDGEFVATVQPWRQGAAAAVAVPAQGWPSALSSPTQEDIAEVEDNVIEEAVEETSYNPLSGSGSGGGSPLVGGGGSHAWQQQQQQREEQEQVEEASEAPPGYPLASMAAAQALLVPGTRIFALYRSGEDWFEGVVKASNGDGTWAVDYGEEDEEEAVPLARMRLGEEPALTAAAAAAQRPVSAGGSRPRMGLIPEAPELAAHLQRSPSPYTQDDFESDGESASAGGGSPLHYQQPQQQHSQAASSLSPSSPAAAAAAPLQPQPIQQPQPAQPSSASTSVSSASNILPALPPGYVYQAVQLSQLEGAAQSQARAAQPAAAAAAAPPPPPPPHPLIGPPNGGFHGGLMGLALALAQASPMLSIGTSSLAAVLNGSRGGAAGAGAAQASLLSALRGEAPGEQQQQQQQSQAGRQAPPPPLPLSTPSFSAPSAPSAAFLRALATGLQGAPPPLPPSAAGSAAAAGLHPSVVSALAQAQASLASMDTLYARQLESIREAAGRARGKLLSVRERASGFPGAGRVGACGPPGGSASPPSAAAAAVHEPAKLPTGQQGRIPGTLSFQEALAMVRREHSARRL